MNTIFEQKVEEPGFAAASVASSLLSLSATVHSRLFQSVRQQETSWNFLATQSMRVDVAMDKKRRSGGIFNYRKH